MVTLKRITALLLTATLTLSLCSVIIPVNSDSTGKYGEEGIAPCSDDSDFGDVDYF